MSYASYQVTELTVEQSIDALVEIYGAPSWFAGERIREAIARCGFTLDDRFAAREYLASEYGYL